MAKRVSKPQPGAGASTDTVLYSSALALVMASVFLGTAAITGLGLALAAGLLVFGLLRRYAVPQRLVPVLATGTALVVWLAIASLRAVNPLVSLAGAFGQHNGTALWVLGLAWLAGGSLWADRLMLRWPLRVVVAAGAAASVATLLEAASVGMRLRDYPAGFFESSSSLGQFAALALIAAVVSALSERSSAWRWTSWTAAALCSAGIIVASSRGGALAVVLALTVAAALVRLPGLTRRPVVTAGVFAGVITALLALVFVASTGRLGTAASGALTAFGTGRGFIWRAGVASFLRSPVVGAGLQQFSAWTDFFSINIGAPTNDPHNVVLALLIGGGIVAGVLAIAAGVALAVAVLDAARGKGFAAVLMLMMPLALFVSALVSWIHPLSMVTAAAITGVALGRGAKTEPAERSKPRGLRPILWTITGLTSAAALLVCYSLPGQIAFSSSKSPTQMLALYKQWPDPFYAIGALRLSTPAAESGDAAARSLIAETLKLSERDAVWRVDLAGNQMQASRALDPQNPARFAEFVAIANRGRIGDPGAAAWDVLLAAEADRLGLGAQARGYAKAALTHELDDETKAAMERISAGQ